MQKQGNSNPPQSPIKGEERHEYLTKMASHERTHEKARLHAEVGIHSFERRGFAVTIKDIQKIGKKLVVNVSAKHEGVNLNLKGINPLEFINPPVIHEGKLNVKETLQEIIVQTLETVLPKE